MIKRWAVGLLLVLIAVPAVSQSGDAADSGEDLLLQRVNAELDREEGEPAAADQDRVYARQVNPVGTGTLLRGIFALCIVLALILTAYYGVRRWGKNVPILAGSHFGSVLGRIYLDRGNALHFVKVADRVLVVGVNANSISLVGNFSAEEFGDLGEGPAPSEPERGEFNPDSFLAQLQAQSRDFAESGAGLPKAEEDEIAALRGDIHRLQRYLREESREYEE